MLFTIQHRCLCASPGTVLYYKNHFILTFIVIGQNSHKRNINHNTDDDDDDDGGGSGGGGDGGDDADADENWIGTILITNLQQFPHGLFLLMVVTGCVQSQNL